MNASKWIKPAAALLLASAFILPSPAFAEAKQPQAHGSITQNVGGGITLEAGKSANANGFKSVDPSHFKTKLAHDKAKKPSLATQGLTAEDFGNHDPNTAIYLDLNTLYQNTMSASGQQDWYYFYVPDASKLTALLPAMQTPNVNYDVHLFHMNDTTGALENEQYSAFGAGLDDQVAMVAQPGYYFMCVNSVQGFEDTNPYLFELMQSYGYDAAEADDSLWQAKSNTADFNVTRNLDNNFDQDWIRFTPSITEYAKVTFDQLPAGSDYMVEVYAAASNGVLQSMGYLPANATGKLAFGQGTTYYFRVLTMGTADPATNYHLQISRQSPRISLNNIDSDPDISGYIEYDSNGFKYRVKGFMNVYGSMRDAEGQVIAGMPVTMLVNTRLGQQSVNGVTDSAGNFVLNLTNMNAAVGTYDWYGPVSIHYYDIIAMAIGSPIANTNETYVTTLYHFAYSVYHQH